MKKTIFYVLTLWLGLWFQVAVDHYLGGSWFSFDALLIASLFFGLARGPFTGVNLGFVWGLFIDAASLGLIGLHALLYASAGYVAGMLRRHLDETKAWTQAIFSFSLSVGYVLLVSIFVKLFSGADRPWSVRLLAQPMANAFLAPILFFLLDKWVAAWGLFERSD